MVTLIGTRLIDCFSHVSEAKYSEISLMSIYREKFYRSGNMSAFDCENVYS